jgi:hypothetical protein
VARARPSKAHLDRLAAEVIEQATAQALEPRHAVLRVQQLAELLVDARLPKKEREAAHALLPRVDGVLTKLIATPAIRFRTPRGMNGELTEAARSLAALVAAEIDALDQAHREAADGREAARADRAAKRRAAADRAYARLPSNTKTPHRQLVAFEALAAGLTPTGMAKLEALAHWGYFLGIRLPVAAGEPLYTDDDGSGASGRTRRERAVKAWEDAFDAIDVRPE